MCWTWRVQRCSPRGTVELKKLVAMLRAERNGDSLTRPHSRSGYAAGPGPLLGDSCPAYSAYSYDQAAKQSSVRLERVFGMSEEAALEDFVEGMQILSAIREPHWNRMWALRITGR